MESKTEMGELSEGVKEYERLAATANFNVYNLKRMSVSVRVCVCPCVISICIDSCARSRYISTHRQYKRRFHIAIHIATCVEVCSLLFSILSQPSADCAVRLIQNHRCVVCTRACWCVFCLCCEWCCCCCRVAVVAAGALFASMCAIILKSVKMVRWM